MKYQIGQRIRVISKCRSWKSSHGNWERPMDETINNNYTIIGYDDYAYLLNTKTDNGDIRYNYYYPEESLSPCNKQLEFAFMEDI